MPETDGNYGDDPDDEDDGDEAESPSKNGVKGGDKRKAGRPPSLYRVYQMRLDKLIEKKDSE
jgi:hypothetical protein